MLRARLAISSRFGMREHPILGYSALHAGVDFAAPSGTPILAAGAGKVVMAGPNGGYATNPADPGHSLFHTPLLSGFLNRKEVALLISGCAYGKPRVIAVKLR